MMKARYTIVPPSEVVPWINILGHLQGISEANFYDLISTREAAVDFAARYRLIANTRKCVRCGKMMLLWCRSGLDGIQWRCVHVRPKSEHQEGRRRSYCSSMSIRHESIFNGHHLPIAVILKFMFMWARNYPLIKIREDTSFSNDMSVIWSSYMRHFAAKFVEAHQLPLGGPNSVVEIGKIMLYKTKKRNEEDPCLLGAVERGTKNCIIHIIEKYSPEALLCAVSQWILPGSVVISDDWANCDGLQRLGYTHFLAELQTPKVEYVNGQEILVNVALIRDLCMQARGKFLSMNGTSKSHFRSYIQEFMFRRILHNHDEFAGLILWAPLLHSY